MLVAIAIGVGVNAWSGQKPVPFNNKLTSFDSRFLGFKYPASWADEPDSMVGSFADGLVFLSNREMHAPCLTRQLANGDIETTCSNPVSRLGYDGVLVHWMLLFSMTNIGPGGTLAHWPGLPILVDGHAGRESVVSKHPGCVRDTRQELSVSIVWIGNSYFEMTACLSGPNLGRERSEVRAMIATTKILRS